MSAPANDTPLPQEEPARELPAGLALAARNKAGWDQPQTRRLGLRQLHRLQRYGLAFRAPRVLALRAAQDERIEGLPAVQGFLGHHFFTGLLVLQGETVLLERYAGDFGPEQLHSIQSITKTSIHLMAGRLVEQGRLDLARTVASYLPEIGSGYARTSVQDLLDMAVLNDYTEDYADPAATVGLMEIAHGWRVLEDAPDADLRAFLCGIQGAGVADGRRRCHYKTANTDVAAWICERVSGLPLREMYLQLVEAAGIEASACLTTDRQGVPFAGGGLHLTLRDLGRYGLLLARSGQGICGTAVGSRAFSQATRAQGKRGTLSLLGTGHYRNFCETNGRWLGHNGYGGQWLMVYPEQELVIACLSAVDDEAGQDWGFIARLAAMGEAVAAQRLDEGARGH